MKYFIALFALAATASLPAMADDKKVDPRCAQYGEGFVYSESTGTCLKISGEIRTDFKGGKKTNAFDTQGELSVDARKATDYGDLRIVFAPKSRF